MPAHRFQNAQIRRAGALSLEQRVKFRRLPPHCSGMLHKDTRPCQRDRLVQPLSS